MNMIYRGITFNSREQALSTSQEPQELQELQELCYRGQRYHIASPALSKEVPVCHNLRYRGVEYSYQSRDLAGALCA